MNEPKTYLIFGANGFVGSYLVEELVRREGTNVKAFDRFTNGPQFAENERVEVIKGDIFSDEDVQQALMGVDYVIHSFSATTPFISDQDPYKDISDNLQRSVRLFELCHEAGVQKIGFISSAGTVYGSVTETKTASEEDAPLPVSPYGINKLSIEHYLEYFKRKFGMSYVVCRLTNPYGPRQVLKHGQGVMPVFIQKIRNHEELNVFGDGGSSRDYIYMPDAARMIVDALLGDNRYNVYNVGSGQQISLNEIISTLQEIMGAEARVNYVEPPKTFLEHSAVSIDRYVSDIGPPNLTSLKTGLKHTVETTA